MENTEEFTQEEMEYFKTYPIVIDGIEYDISDLFTDEDGPDK